jgi:hypothetical protein
MISSGTNDIIYFFLLGHFLLTDFFLLVFATLFLFPDTGPCDPLRAFLLRTALTCFFFCAVSDVEAGKRFFLAGDAFDFFFLSEDFLPELFIFIHSMFSVRTKVDFLKLLEYN